MALARSRAYPFSPTSLSDTLDGTNVPRGAMASLRNLIPDPSTKNLWQCRPASLQLTDFTGFTTPAFVSVALVVGTRCYGMIASALNSGKDEPFCYDIASGSFITITGVTNANSPSSPATSGAWTPPTMDIIGTQLIVTHPGFTGAAGVFFGCLDISNPAAPTWSGTNTTTNALPAVPVAVKQFNGRAYFLVNPATGQPGAYFSDALIPLNISSASHILTFGDNAPLTALGALPLNNQLGGIIQSLIVFKSDQNMFQVTGDDALSNLAVNALNIATGTKAPNSICPTPKGLAFVAPDGVRVINFQAQVSDPLGNAGNGVVIPFVAASVPSRITAACNSSVLRITTQNTVATGNPFEEYWYDLARNVWSGPHSFPASIIEPYGYSFIMFPVGVTGKMYQSDIAQTSTSTFVENGQQMSFTFITSMLPDTQQMAQQAMVESTIKIATAANSQYSILAIDDAGAIIDSVLITTSGSSTVWGSFTWGNAIWGGGGQNGLAIRQLPWHFPIVFQRLAIEVTGNSSSNLRLGDIALRYQELGYLLQV